MQVKQPGHWRTLNTEKLKFLLTDELRLFKGFFTLIPTYLVQRSNQIECYLLQKLSSKNVTSRLLPNEYYRVSGKKSILSKLSHSSFIT